MKENPDKDNPYKAFVISCGLSDQATADGIWYMSPKLNYDELNDMMKELAQ
jgi:hypothetical protein